MGKDEKDKKDKDKKDKDKKDKDKDKDKKDKDKDKDKKDKDKDKDKKDKDKKKDDKKDKDKKDKSKGDQAWKMDISQLLDTNISTFDKITKTFKDIDDYILKEAKSKEDFINKVNESISKLPEGQKNIFTAFLNSIP